MKKMTICVLACWAALQVCAAEPIWPADLTNAVAQAKAENKAVLLVFTGSDLGGAPTKWKNEVSVTPEFAQYVRTNLVLVEVDFPRTNLQSEATKEINQGLKAWYKVPGYPTFVLLNGEGKEIARLIGYTSGGPTVFLANLEERKARQAKAASRN